MSNNIHCLIVDDEPLAITVLETYLQKLEGVSFQPCDNAITALQRMQSTPYDLVFLDLDMPFFSGLELIKTLKQPPAIIITSAYTEFAVQSFEYEVLDYLVKPFSFPRFMNAFERFLRLQAYKQAAPQPPVEGGGEGFLFLKTEKKYIRVKLSDILFIESVKDYIKVHTTTSSILTYQTLHAFTNQLPSQQFARVHRSYTIALDKVDVFDPEHVEIAKRTIPISRELRKAVIARLVAFHR